MRGAQSPITIPFKLKAVSNYIVGWAGESLEILGLFGTASDVEESGLITARGRSADEYLERINAALGRDYSEYTLVNGGFSVNQTIPDFDAYRVIP